MSVVGLKCHTINCQTVCPITSDNPYFPDWALVSQQYIRKHFQKLCIQIIHAIWNILRMNSFGEGYLFHFHVAVGKVNACFHNGETFNVRLTRSRAAQIIWYICPNTNDILLEFFCFLLQWNFSKIQTDSVSILINPFIKQAQQSKIHFLALLELSENKMRFSGPGAPGLSRGREVHQSGSQ